MLFQYISEFVVHFGVLLEYFCSFLIHIFALFPFLAHLWPSLLRSGALLAVSVAVLDSSGSAHTLIQTPNVLYFLSLLSAQLPVHSSASCPRFIQFSVFNEASEKSQNVNTEHIWSMFTDFISFSCYCTSVLAAVQNNKLSLITVFLFLCETHSILTACFHDVDREKT